MSRRRFLSPEWIPPDKGGLHLHQVEGEEVVSSSSVKYHRPTVAPVYPAETVLKTEVTTLEDWPHQEDCTAFTSPEYFPPVFLPPENKGFE